MTTYGRRTRAVIITDMIMSSFLPQPETVAHRLVSKESPQAEEPSNNGVAVVGRQGILLVFSGPSGVGKGSICRALIKENQPSTTSRLHPFAQSVKCME